MKWIWLIMKTNISFSLLNHYSSNKPSVLGKHY